jgi:hypothetical protein
MSDTYYKIDKGDTLELVGIKHTSRSVGYNSDAMVGRGGSFKVAEVDDTDDIIRAGCYWYHVNDLVIVRKAKGKAWKRMKTPASVLPLPPKGKKAIAKLRRLGDCGDGAALIRKYGSVQEAWKEADHCDKAWLIMRWVGKSTDKELLKKFPKPPLLEEFC